MVTTNTIPTHPEGKTMKAVCFSSFGKDPKKVLEVKTIPRPFIISGDGDDGEGNDGTTTTTKSQLLLIKVHACALNPIDKIRLNGDLAAVKPEQFTDNNVLGYDVSGMAYGALSEYVVCSATEVALKPTSISFAEAASFPLAGLTAYQSLKRGGVKEGSKVFIPGGAGGVGSLAIQIAKSVFKAGYVCTTASPGQGTELCQELGADRIIDYRSEDFETVLKGEDFDMAFDTMHQGDKMGTLLKKGGKIISISGPPSIEAIEEGMGGSVGFVVKMLLFLTRNRKAEKAAEKAGGSWEYIFMKPSGDDLKKLGAFLERGEIKAVIDTEVDGIDNFMTAVDKLWSGRSKGKCVIKIIV
ncbi:NAD(P)-binding protein [Fragilariopsis cylindrus CCMP1102]|uniref:NAD(P)-binding protein n=1 Tax=Fragilariopsis cylindrus CCMP1102 TaxID=635003 RepID=A0A1E7F1X4_9STRA|nr:NAD(P)-binding protein [Fragilariopsis cylindrus CCMP1102]|eukprot:OEU12127.1 NAD(P)-binding protein [Fragilariopsis cylindrus CCMP1102]